MEVMMCNWVLPIAVISRQHRDVGRKLCKVFFFFQIYLLPHIFFNAFQAENYGFRFPSQLVELQLSNAIDSAENSQDFKTATKTLKISSEIKKRDRGVFFTVYGIRRLDLLCKLALSAFIIHDSKYEIQYIFLYLNNICV